MTEPIAIRRAEPADAPALARGAVDALDDYPGFAPAGWHAVTVPYFDPIPGLPMVEYRLPLG